MLALLFLGQRAQFTQMPRLFERQSANCIEVMSKVSLRSRLFMPSEGFSST
jgi:hypothetical protein